MTLVQPSDDEQSFECIGVEVMTNAMLRERGYRNSGKPFELAFFRRGRGPLVMPVESLQRVREIIEELRPPEIVVMCASDENQDALLAQCTRRAADIHELRPA